MKITQLIILAIIITSVGYSRIGETSEELITRYGQPSDRRSDGVRDYLSFSKNKVMIGCVLKEGKTVAVLYRFFNDIKPEEAGKLLEANSEGMTWTEKTNTVFHKNWTRSDSQLTAIITKHSLNTMVVSKSGFLADEAKRAVDGEPTKLDGF